MLTGALKTGHYIDEQKLENNRMELLGHSQLILPHWPQPLFALMTPVWLHPVHNTIQTLNNKTNSETAFSEPKQRRSLVLKLKGNGSLQFQDAHYKLCSVTIKQTKFSIDAHFVTDVNQYVYALFFQVLTSFLLCFFSFDFTDFLCTLRKVNKRCNLL